MRDNTFWVLIWTLVAVVMLACIAMGYSHCEAQYDRREACEKRGHSPIECKALYPSVGGDQ